ncbi:unnamed protein product, partial [Echinostoma caproni]|uniref:Pecanex-like protein n=1 Tax=Echinostoma caproni TaxID=27848 RepID=A0A183AVD4_9TREM
MSPNRLPRRADDLRGSSPGASDLNVNGETKPVSSKDNRKLCVMDRVTMLNDTSGVKSRGRTLDLSSTGTASSKPDVLSRPEINEKLDPSTGDFGSSKRSDSVDEGLGLDFGSSLLDEVFKCFSLSSSAGVEDSVPDIKPDQYESTVSSSLSNTTVKTTLQTTVTAFTATTTTTSMSVACESLSVPVEQPVKEALRDPSPVRNGRTDSPSPKRFGSKILTDTQPEVTFKPKYVDLSIKPDEPTVTNPESPTPSGTARILSRTSTLGPSSMFRSTRGRDETDQGSARRSRTRTREPVGASDDEDQGADGDRSGFRSRWKRSTFGSLSRRSLSVSKVSGHSRDASGRNETDPSDGLRSSKRLTISRPVLITKPILPGDPSLDSLNLGQLPATSSSTLTSLGPGTIDRTSLRSSVSRDSSLTIVSAANDYPHSG